MSTHWTYFWRTLLPQKQEIPKKHDDDNQYPLDILLTGPTAPKTRNTWKNMMMMMSSSRFLRYFLFLGSSSHFSGISCFWGSRSRQKYAKWVLIGCGIKCRIQRALPIKIWSKTKGYMSKIQTKKVIFFMIPIPKFILKNCLRGAFNFKAFLLANRWWHGICIIFGRPILNWNFL